MHPGANATPNRRVQATFCSAPGGTRVLPIFPADAKARHEKMVSLGERTLELHEQLPVHFDMLSREY